MTKQELRRRMREEIKTHSEEELAMMSSAICQRLAENERIIRAQRIYAFWPMASEPDIRPLIHTMYNEGKTILLPRVISKTQMEFCLYEGDESMAPVPPYGIMEPIKGCQPSVESIKGCQPLDELMLVPGVAFDSIGHRLGHGCGYYDRYLAEHPMQTIPVYFPFQLVPVVPTDKYDINIQTII